ncbi:MAG: geranylgeranyl reductase family protein [Halobacteria archaeon]
MTDLAVVGCGPAGARTAKNFASQGHDVVVLEKGVVGKPLACSGHVSGDIWSYLPDGAKDDLLQNKIKGARFHVDGQTYRFYKDETVSYVIDRVEMDRVFAEEARDAGAEIRTETPVRRIHEGAAGVRVETPDDVVQAEMVAGCDGPRSRTRADLGIEDPTRTLQGILAFTEEDDDGDFVDVYLDVPDFFGWRIPRGDSVEYGAASERHVQRRFREIVSPECETVDLCAGHIPIGPPSTTVSNRGFLVGDAAAQVKPFTGGGILYGLTAADIAARVIDLSQPGTLPRYDEEWRDVLGRDIFLGDIVRRGYGVNSILQRLGLRSFRGEINVHMDRPTTLFNRRTLRRVFSNLFTGTETRER